MGNVLDLVISAALISNIIELAGLFIYKSGRSLTPGFQFYGRNEGFY